MCPACNVLILIHVLFDLDRFVPIDCRSEPFSGLPEAGRAITRLRTNATWIRRSGGLRWFQHRTFCQILLRQSRKTEANDRGTFPFFNYNSVTQKKRHVAIDWHLIMHFYFIFRLFIFSLGWNGSPKVLFGFRCCTDLLHLNLLVTNRSATFVNPVLSLVWGIRLKYYSDS